MTTPPTWRALAARARRLGVQLQHGAHEASIRETEWPIECRFSSWTYRDRMDSLILRTAIAAALEQLEAKR